MSIFTDKIACSDLMEQALLEYGIHELETKVTGAGDGLLAVQKHSLLCMQDGRERRLVEITGETIGRYHPAGEDSVNYAIINMSQTFSNLVPLVLNEGNFGSYGGSPPAAPRYQEVAISPFAKSVYFDGIDPTAYSYKIDAHGKGLVPKQLIPKIPMALITGGFGIALGYMSNLIPYSVHGVCEFALRYIDIAANNIANCEAIAQEQKLHRFLFPDSPHKQTLLNHKQLMRAYDRAEFRYAVVAEGIINITTKAIEIISLPHGQSIDDVCTYIGMAIIGKTVNRKPLDDTFFKDNFVRCTNRSGRVVEGCIVCELRRGVDPFAILKPFMKRIKLIRSKTPSIVYMDLDGSCRYISPYGIVARWYIERRRAVLSSMKIKIDNILSEQRKNEAELIMVDADVHHITDIFNNAATPEDTVDALVRDYKLTPFQAAFIAEYTFARLTKLGKDDLLKKKAQLKERLEKAQADMRDVSGKMKRDVLEIQKRYGKPREHRTVLPNYLGYIQVNGIGIINFDTLEDMHHTALEFSKSNLDIKLYPKGKSSKCTLDNGVLHGDEYIDLSRYITANQVFASKTKFKYTIRIENGYISRYEGLTSCPSCLVTPVSDKMVALFKNKTMAVIDATSIPSRKSTKSTGIKTDIVKVFPYIGDEFIVSHGNTEYPSNIFLYKTTGGAIPTMPKGDMVNVCIHPVNDKIIVSGVPNAKRVKISHVVINKPLEALEFCGKLTIDLGRKTTSANGKLKRLFKNSISIYQL